MIIIFKLFAIALAVIAISKSYLDYKRKLEPKIMFIFWVIVWLVATVLVTYPVIVERLNAYTKDQSLTIGSITSVSYIFMLYIVYRIYAKAARLEHQLSRVTRNVALTPPEHHKKKTKK